MRLDAEHVVQVVRGIFESASARIEALQECRTNAITTRLAEQLLSMPAEERGRGEVPAHALEVCRSFQRFVPVELAIEFSAMIHTDDSREGPLLCRTSLLMHDHGPPPGFMHDVSDWILGREQQAVLIVIRDGGGSFVRLGDHTEQLDQPS